MKRRKVGAESFKADGHDAGNSCFSQMHVWTRQIAKGILKNSVNDSVCRHFPLSSTPNKHNISVTGAVSTLWWEVLEAHT